MLFQASKSRLVDIFSMVEEEEGLLCISLVLNSWLVMTGAVFKAGSEDKTVLQSMQLSLFSMFGITNSWRCLHGNDCSVTRFSLNREEVELI